MTKKEFYELIYKDRIAECLDSIQEIHAMMYDMDTNGDEGLSMKDLHDFTYALYDIRKNIFRVVSEYQNLVNTSMTPELMK